MLCSIEKKTSQKKKCQKYEKIRYPMYTLMDSVFCIFWSIFVKKGKKRPKLYRVSLLFGTFLAFFARFHEIEKNFKKQHFWKMLIFVKFWHLNFFCKKKLCSSLINDWSSFNYQLILSLRIEIDQTVSPDIMLMSMGRIEWPMQLILWVPCVTFTCYFLICFILTLRMTNQPTFK